MVKQKKSRQPAVNKMPGGVGSPVVVESGAQSVSAEALSVRQLLLTGLMAVLFFLAVCLSSVATVKGMAMLLLIVGVATVFFGMGVLRDHVGPLFGLVAAWVLMDGISTLYAISGKFALYEFLKVIISFCLLLIMLALARGRGWQPGRRLAMVLSMAAALMALVSIDMISTRLVSGAVLALLGAFTPDYTGLDGLEIGVRMTSLFANPNIFAGCVGIGVLLSLGLVQSAGGKGEKALHIFCLFVNAMGFMLAFSMGASGIIALAFWVYLLLEVKTRRASLLILMLETLILTVLAAGIVSVTSFDAWQSARPVPLLLALLGPALLFVLDNYVGRPLSDVLNRRAWLVEAVMYATLTLLVVFVMLAYNLHGAVTLQPGESLRRAAYPEPGHYTLEYASMDSSAIQVSIESQNQQETMMHTSTILYNGALHGAEFDVLEGSSVVYFTLVQPADGGSVTLDALTYQGTNGSGDIPLGYPLLPGFVANRLQGLWANENAIQRLVFFDDGIKLWQRSPIFGLGIGAYENGIKSVQSFYYETKYAHNHYIQSLVETGIIGLILFVGMLLVGAVSVLMTRKGRGEGEIHPMVPALGAALVFMAGHAATEVVFSSYPYLPMAFGVLALLILCCDKTLPMPELSLKVRTGCIFGAAAFLVLFIVLLGGNLAAANMISDPQKVSFEKLAAAAAIDKYEWADYELSYVRSTLASNINEDIQKQADKYAEHLAKVNSNTIPFYLAEYYFGNNRQEEAFAMLEKYVNYVSSDASAWQNVFNMLINFEQNTTSFRQGAARIVEIMNNWNEQNMGQIQLDAAAQEFVARQAG